MLRGKLQRQTGAGYCVAKVDRSVFGIFRFQDVEDGVLEFGGGNQHICRECGLPLERRLDFQRVQNISVNRGGRIQSFCQFRGIRSPKDLPLAVGNLFPGCAVAEAKRFDDGLFLLIERESNRLAGEPDFCASVPLRVDLRV